MGMCATAIFCYGYVFRAYDERRQPWDDRTDEWDWPVMLAATKDVYAPTVEFDSNNPEVLGVYHSYWQKRNDIEKASPVVIEYAGGGDEMDRIVCIRASLLMSDWDKPLIIPDEWQRYGLGWDTQLNDFCVALDIKLSDEDKPGWVLAARYW